VSTAKIKQTAQMRQRMRVTLLLNWEAKQKCSQDMLRMGRYPNTCWRVGHKLNADHSSPCVMSGLPPQTTEAEHANSKASPLVCQEKVDISS
jgi:hypothetical protein